HSRVLQAIISHIPLLVQQLGSNPQATPLAQTGVMSLLKEQPLAAHLHLVNQIIDVVQKVIRTKDEYGESSLSGSPFIPEIQDKLIPQHFRLPMLEAYDGGFDPMEHVAVFRA
ncbi:hypothetical protein B296_00022063, partial [Ensete ventricosum]